MTKLMQETLFDSIGDSRAGAGGGNQSRGRYEAGSRIGGIKIPDINNVGSLSVAKQTKVFLDKLEIEADQRGNNVFDYADLVMIGRSICMNVGDFSMFIEKLNIQNELILAGPKQWKLLSKRL